MKRGDRARHTGDHSLTGTVTAKRGTRIYVRLDSMMRGDSICWSADLVEPIPKSSLYQQIEMMRDNMSYTDANYGWTCAIDAVLDLLQREGHA